MRSGMVALNPRAAESQNLSKLCAQLHSFQERGLWKELDIVSLVHANFFPFPAEIYHTRKEAIKDEVKRSLAKGLSTSIRYNDIEVIEVPYSNDDDMVALLSRLALKKRSNVLILGVDTQQNIFKWLAGGIPETAALSAQTPVLILKVDEYCPVPEGRPGVVLAIDAAAPPSKRAMRRFWRFIRPLQPHVHLVNILRRQNVISSLISAPPDPVTIQKVMEETQAHLKELRIESDYEIIHEMESIGVTLSKFADKKGACLTAVSSPIRDVRHRLLWGSTTQSLLGELKCPLLILRSP